MSGDGATSPVSAGGISIEQAVKSAVAVGADRGEPVFVVGGVVRDLFCGRAVGDQDLDLVVQGDGIAFAKALADQVGGVITTHPAFLTAKLQSPFSDVLQGRLSSMAVLSEVDIVTARSERYEAPGALPVVAAASIEHDLLRRDFSVNAMALPLGVYRELLAGECGLDQLQSAVIDPCAGKGDLDTKTLRILHRKSFFDDPTRLFRCLRYSVRMGFSLDESTRTAFDEAVAQGALRTLSTRRVWNELMTAAIETEAAAIVSAFEREGLLKSHPLLPSDQHEATVQALQRLADMRGSLKGGVVRDAATLLFVVALQRASINDVLREAQIPKSVQRKARGVLQLVDEDSIFDPSAAAPGEDSLCAAFALSGRADFRVKLTALEERGSKHE